MNSDVDEYERIEPFNWKGIKIDPDAFCEQFEYLCTQLDGFPAVQFVVESVEHFRAGDYLSWFSQQLNSVHLWRGASDDVIGSAQPFVLPRLRQLGIKEIDGQEISLSYGQIMELG